MKINLKPNRTHRLPYIFIAALLLLMSAAAWGGNDLISHLRSTIDSGEILRIVAEISAPEYEGRLTGTSGFNKAAQWAADYFKQQGLKPVFEDYYQRFPLNFTKVFESSLRISLTHKTSGIKTITGEYFKNFYPLGFSGSGDVKGKIVFAGYGITAPEMNIDDYANLDVTGKIVMVIYGRPTARSGENWQPYYYHDHRITNARDRGAAAVLYVRPAVAAVGGTYAEGLPVVSITDAADDEILRASTLKVKTIKEAKESLNSRRPLSGLTAATAQVTVKSENSDGEGRNVVAVIPGTDPELKEEYIVIGAHLDHCGSLPLLTPGAEDNGSGSAALLTAAKAFASYNLGCKRSILFILFGGEEMGLLGSRHFITHLPEGIKAEKIRFMINMDMVGAGINIFVMGLENYPRFETLLRAAAEKFNYRQKISGNKVEEPYRANTDSYPFLEQGVAAVTFFSADGDHHGYHTNSDTVYWITPKITEDIVRMVSFCTVTLADRTLISRADIY